MPVLAEWHVGWDLPLWARRTAVPAVVSSIEDPAHANTLIAIVIIVAKKALAKRTHAQFIRVSKIDGNRLELGSVELAAHHCTPTILDMRAVCAIHIESCVAVRHPPFVVRAEHETVSAMVVVKSAEACQQFLGRAIRFEISILILVHPQIRTGCYIHL